MMGPITKNHVMMSMSFERYLVLLVLSLELNRLDPIMGALSQNWQKIVLLTEKLLVRCHNLMSILNVHPFYVINN